MHATRRNARHPEWVELGLKVSPEPTSARRCGSSSPLFQRIRRWREHRHRDGGLDFDSQKYHLEFDSDLKLFAKRLVR
jgi:hypothetical protein